MEVMSFSKLAGAVVALYALLNFVVLPRLTKAWRANRTLGKAAKAGVVGAAEFVRDVTLVAGVLYVTFGLLTVLLGLTFHRNVGWLARIVTAASSLHTTLNGIKRLVEAWFFLLPLGILTYISWWRGKRAFGRRYERAVDAAYDRLNQEREANPERWQAVPADERMRVLDQEINAVEQELASLDPAAPNAVARRQAMLRRLVLLRERRQEADYERRVDVAGLDEAAAGPDLPGGWRAFLISRGLFADLKGGTKLLSRATLVLLSLALIGVASAAGLSDSLWNRIVALDQLRVNLVKQQVVQQWQQAGKPAPLDETDKKAVDQLSHDFAWNLLRNPHWVPHGSAGQTADFAHLRQSLTERAILAEVRLPDAAGTEQPAFVDDAAGPEREVGETLRSTRPAESTVGQTMASQEGGRVKSWFGRRWGDARQAILAHASLYAEPVDMKDVERAILDKVLGTAVDGALPDFKLGELGKQARSALSAGTKSAVKEAVTTEFHRAVMDLAGGKPYEQVMNEVQVHDLPFAKTDATDLALAMAQHRLPTAADIDRSFSERRGWWRDRDQPPAASADDTPDDDPSGTGTSGMTGPPSPPPDEPGGSGAPPPPPAPPGGFPGPAAGGYTSASAEQSAIRDIATRYAGDGRHSLPERAIEAAAGYEDHFPRSVASLERTTFGRAMREFRGAADAVPFAASAELKVARAGSFAMLRGFSRVGGVLIGREPDDPTSRASVADITWRPEGRLVTLSLIQEGSGGRVDLGPFDQSLVHQALAYAADGRPVAVTMTNANPLPQLKINLHPALLDTPLGCRVTHLDRLVDTYAGDLPMRQELSERYEQENAVYDVAWAERASTVAHFFRDSAEIKAEAGGVRRAQHEAAEAGLRRPTLLGAQSILRRKPEFYDPELVDAVRACVRGGGVSQFEQCIHDRVTDSDTFKDRDRDALDNWLSDPTTIMVWSGVRERSFKVTPDLAFLRPPADRSISGQLWPFDFMVQVAFTSPAAGLPPAQRVRYADQHPLEFDEITPDIQRRILAGANLDGLGPMLQDLRDFTILQRLFRVALHGGLGPRFPLAKLAQLTAQTARGIPYVRTPRWNGSQTESFQAMLARLVELNPPPEPWMTGAAIRGNACLRAVRETRGDRPAPHPEECDFEMFRTAAERACPPPAGSHSPACAWRTVVEIARRMPTLRRYELAFGVVEDALKSHDDLRCPALAPAKTAPPQAGNP